MQFRIPPPATLPRNSQAAGTLPTNHLATPTPATAARDRERVVPTLGVVDLRRHRRASRTMPPASTPSLRFAYLEVGGAGAMGLLARLLRRLF